MKNEKRVLAKFINGQYCLPSRQGICISSNENYSDYIPQIISVYGYDYIREDKIPSGIDRALYEVISNGTNNFEKDKEEKTELNIGDTVVLKSGSPIMTVIEIYDNGKVSCAWFMDNNDTDSITVPISCLKEVEKVYEYNQDKCFDYIYISNDCKKNDLLDFFNDIIMSVINESKFCNSSVKDIYNKYKFKWDENNKNRS